MAFPPSPSLSEAAFATSDTQIPPSSIQESLHNYGISLETANKWKRQYNRQEVRVMDDKDFFGLVLDIAKESGHEEIQPRLKASIDRKSSCLQVDFQDAAFTVLLPGHELSLTNNEKFAFTSSYNPDTTLHSIQSFMAYCVPHLVDLAQNSASKRRQNEKPGSTQASKPKMKPRKNTASKSQSQSQKISKSSRREGKENLRRSRRIDAQHKKGLALG